MRVPLIDRQAPRPLLGLCIMYPAPGIAERIGPDWDWLWIDAQHGDLDFRNVADLVRAGQWAGCPALVRVPSHDEGWIGRALDTGAAGVIVPLVETVEEAKKLIRAAKFPPLGNRSYGGRRVIDLVGRTYYESANRDVLLIIQLESTAACGIAGELAALEGIDGLFLGPDDLTIRDGRHVNSPKDRVAIGKQMEMVAEACRRHGKLSVCVAGAQPGWELVAEFKYDLVVGGGDVGFLATGSAEASKKLRQYFQQSNVPRPVGGNLY